MKQVTVEDYIAIRKRFFGESDTDARQHALSLPKGAERWGGRSDADILSEAARSVLAVDAANAKWIAL